MVEKPAALSNTVVLGVEDAFDQVFGRAVDDDGRRWRLFSVFESVREFGFQLRNMEYWMNANSGREFKGENHKGRLGNNKKGTDLLFSQLSSGSVGTNVIGTQ